MKEKTIGRIAEIIKERYGCRFELIDSKTPLNSSKQDLLASAIKNPNAPMMVRKDHLIIPLKVNDRVAGIAVIYGGINLEPDDTEKLKDLIDLTIKAIFENSPKNRGQAQKEKEIEDSLRSILSSKKVVSFGLPKTPIYKEEGYTLSKHSLHMLIQGPDVVENRRIALEIHESSDSHAFLSLTDLERNSIQRVDDVENLGNMIIFIEELALVPRSVQKVLTEYLEASLPENSGPQIIASTMHEPRMLLERNVVESRLLKALGKKHFRVPRVDKNCKGLRPLVNIFQEIKS